MKTPSFGSRAAARLLRFVSPRLTQAPAELALLNADIRSDSIDVPTRHGDVRCIAYRPATQTPPRPTPLYVHFHGGAFIVRNPEQDGHLCRHVVARTGATVLSVDYDTAPDVQYPTAEEECHDVVAWARQHCGERGWDTDAIAVGGTSAGAKLAVNVCQQAHAAATQMPMAVVFAYGVADMTLAPHERTSPKRVPAVAPWLIRLMYGSYLPDARRHAEPLASPAFDDELGYLPPTLILTGGLDAMAPEGRRFADRLASLGVSVTYREFADVDHGFTNNAPVSTALAALDVIITHLRAVFAVRSGPVEGLPW